MKMKMKTNMNTNMNTNMKTLCMITCTMLLVFFTSCEEDDNSSDKTKTDGISNIYIVNYGSYSGAKSTISIFNNSKDTVINEAYKSANGTAYSSNIESFSIYEGKGYLMGNNGDKIDIIDIKTLKQTANPVSDSIIKPRQFTAQGNNGYISCWGNVQNWDTVNTSYIAVMDLESQSVTQNIALPGGPEDVMIKNDKLYAALEYREKIAVIDLTDYSVSYIRTPAVAQRIVEGVGGNIWVSLVSTYSDPSPADSIGLACIDVASDQIIDKISFSGIGSNGYLATNKAKDSIYVMGKEPYPSTTSNVYVVDINNKTLSSEPVVSGENYNGIGFNKESGNLYVLVSPGAEQNGLLHVYGTDGSLINDYEAGIAPKEVIFIN